MIEAMGDVEAVPVGETALDVLHETFQRVKATDPTDIETALLAGYEGLCLTYAADRVLEETVLAIDFARFFPGDNFLGGGGRQRLDIALAWLDAAPSLPALTPQHDFFTMLVPPQVTLEVYGKSLTGEITDAEATELAVTETTIVVVAMKSMWSQVHTLLTRAAEHASDPDDRRACRIAALMAHELLHPEQIDYRRDINRRIMAARVDRRRTRSELRQDDRLMALLDGAVGKAARAEDRWATLKKVVAALHRADEEYMPEKWGFDTDLGLISSTGRFDIRKVERNGRKVTEVRAR